MNSSAPSSPDSGTVDNTPCWVVVQLSSTGEREKNVSLIVHAARTLLRRPAAEVFIPAVSQKVRDESLTTFYMDGYVFIRFEEGISYLRLQETTYFSSVLCRRMPNGRPQYSLLADTDIAPMRAGMGAMKLSLLNVDDRVRVVKGVHKNLQGVVSTVYDGEENVQVYVDLRSKKILIDFPSTYLEKMSE